MRDLFPGPVGGELAQRSTFPDTREGEGFSTDADANVVNTTESIAIEDNAAGLADHLLSRASEVVPAMLACVDPGFAPSAIDACVGDFIRSFGARAYRRPLTDAEAGIVRGLYDDVRGREGPVEGWAAVMEFFLQAPALLYRVERGGEPVPELPGWVRLDGYELASRLSYFFWGTMPDDALFEAARQGELETREQVAAQARRLAASPRALDTLARFHREWLKVGELTHAERNQSSFPAFSDTARRALLGEMRGFMRHVMEDRDGSLQTLFSSNDFPVAAGLEALYGGPDAVSTERHGILTLASVMAAHGGPDATNPIERGAFIRREVLCNPPPPLPGDVDTSGPLESTADRPTARQRLAPLLERSPCNGCHSLFNPLGYAFEQYDAVGQFRTHENGVRIDPSGDLSVEDARGTFADATDLSALIATSDVAHRCYAEQWFHFAAGRHDLPEEACMIDELGERFIDSGGDIRQLLVAITQTPAFMYRPVPSEAR